MRLDHLLSKEHFLTGLARFRGRHASECLALVAHGWNVDYSADLLGRRLASTALRSVERMISGQGPAGHAVGYLKVRPFGREPSMPAPVNSLIAAG